MVDLFVSYARKDRPLVQKLAAIVGGHGWKVWWDRDIPLGDSFQRAIQEALTEARCVSVIWTQAALASDWVMAEAEDGRQRKILLPILVEPVRIPVPFNLVQAADLLNWDGQSEHPGIEALLGRMKTLLGSPDSVSHADAVRLISQFVGLRRINLSPTLERVTSSTGSLACAAPAADALGVVYCHVTGAYSGQVFYVRKGISILYHDDHEGAKGPLGLPVSNEELADGAGFPTSYFENGLIEWSPKTWHAQAYLIQDGKRIKLGESRYV